MQRTLLTVPLLLCCLACDNPQGLLDLKRAAEHCNRAGSWCSEAEYEKAIEEYTEALRLNPRLAKAYCGRARALLLYNDQNDRAIADFNEAIRLDPGLADAYYGRGVAWGKKREYDRAITDFKVIPGTHNLIRAPRNRHQSLTPVICQ